MELPCVLAPAMEDVIRKTPPSGLALNVGAALRRRWRWDLVFTAQHYFRLLFLSFFFPNKDWFFFYAFMYEKKKKKKKRLLTLSHSSSDKALRSTLEENLVHP